METVHVQPVILSDSATCDHAVPLEGDCACPSAALFPLGTCFLPVSVPWKRTPGLYQGPLDDEWQLAFSPLGPVPVSVLNGPAQRVLDAFSEPRTFAQAIDTITGFHSGDLRETMKELARLGLIGRDASSSSPASMSDTLEAWLQVTNACNLRCDYCYVAKDTATMSHTVSRAAVDAVMRSAGEHGFSAVKLKYAGGEPTLNFEVVRSIHTYAQQMADERGIELREVVLSNGVALDDLVFGFLQQNRVRLMISIDGIGQLHDRQRHFADGRGSFDLVTRSIDRALEHGLKPYLSITITKRNLSGIAGIVGFALERDMPFNLNFYRARYNETHACAWIPESHQLVGAIEDALAVIEDRLPSRPLLGNLLDRAAFTQPHLHACGAGRSYLVIDCHGRVARCQIEMHRPVTDIGSEDPLAEVRAHRTGFANLPVDSRHGCRTCSWRYWCAGGCPLHSAAVSGRSDIRSPYCEVYQALYPKILQLEAKRLLAEFSSSVSGANPSCGRMFF